MTISRQVSEAMQGASWIRKMFEEGIRLKREHGDENVADLALGNPMAEPPGAARDRMIELAGARPGGAHRYMPNAGFTSTRAAIAHHLELKTGIPYGYKDVIMTVGAGGALNVVLKGLIDQGDEVICLAPYFVEYRFYIDNHGGKMVLVQTDENFRPNVELIEQAITDRTRAVFVNSPNNPSGVVYPKEDFEALGDLLRRKSAEYGRPIYLVSDEPYRAIRYEGVVVPWPVTCYRDTIHITSFSKDLAMPGERIGYIGVNPESEGAGKLASAFTFTNRILGFVNAPAFQQRLVEGLLEVRLDLTDYQRKREKLLAALDAGGYPYVRPMGAFYIFPSVPVEDMDDLEFVNLCLEERLLVVPGSGFGRPGHFRMSYAVTDRDVDLAVDALHRVAQRIGGGAP